MFLHFKLKMEHLECGPVKHAILRILTTKWKLRMQAHPHKIVLYTWFSIYFLVLLVWCLENCSTQVIVKTHAICKVFCIFCFFFTSSVESSFVLAAFSFSEFNGKRNRLQHFRVFGGIIVFAGWFFLEKCPSKSINLKLFCFL